jgi:glycosyltransferase involved in cell wall biosynthesis
VSIRVRALYTFYPHMGAHSGYRQLLGHLDPACLAVRAHAVADHDADRALPHLSGWLRARVQGRGMPWYTLRDLAAETRALGSCLLRRTDIVHFLDAEHSVQYLPGLLKKMRLSSVKTVATYHQPPEMLDGLIHREVVSQVDHVILVSPVQEPYFLEFLPRERVHVVLLGVDTEFFRPVPMPAGPRPFRCICVGHWLRDWTALRAVATRLASRPSVELHVVTDRETGFEGLANVRTHRRVDDATLRSLYRQSDLLLMPLTQSTANNALVEGIACGLPVVSTDLPSLRAYLPGGEAVLVKDNDADELAAAVVQLEEDTERRREMSKRARERAEQLDWSRVARVYEALYAQALGRAESVPRDGVAPGRSLREDGP